MKTMRLAICILVGALAFPMTGYAADTDKSTATEFVKDSVITTKIKAKLAKARPSSLVHISVDTDAKGVVVLSGTVASKMAEDKAVSIARGVKGVTSVESRIKIEPGK